MKSLKKDVEAIIKACLAASQPDAAVKNYLKEIDFGTGRLILVAIGKAAWSMARAAQDELGQRIDQGIVITKYGHVKGELPGILCREAGHPVPDEASYAATREAVEMTRDLEENDRVLFLISGGGSALFEDPSIPEEELLEITRQLLASGADIVEINTIRKRLSRVKGGRYAEICAPARMECIVLSDIIGDPLDMIASGPAYPDSSTREEALEILRKYNISLSLAARAKMDRETPKTIENVRTFISGSVRELTKAAARKAGELGYESRILTDCLVCEAREAGSFLGSIARSHAAEGPLAFIAGGETVVSITGTGKGGRNQELALASAELIDGLKEVVIFSLGSDGTDGPTDAAGGIVDGTTKAALLSDGISIHETLTDNNSYEALARINGLIMTGPTGTNVNDVSVVLIGRSEGS